MLIRDNNYYTSYVRECKNQLENIIKNLSQALLRSSLGKFWVLGCHHRCLIHRHWRSSQTEIFNFDFSHNFDHIGWFYKTRGLSKFTFTESSHKKYLTEQKKKKKISYMDRRYVASWYDLFTIKLVNE